MDQFKEIRPYNDNEVRQVLERLTTDDELINTLAKMRFRRLSNYFPWIFH